MYRVVDCVYATSEDGTTQVPASEQADTRKQIWVNYLSSEQIKEMVQISKQSLNKQDCLNQEYGECRKISSVGGDG